MIIVPYCIIDDDTKNTMHCEVSDLDKLRDNLVETTYYSNHHVFNNINKKLLKQKVLVRTKDNKYYLNK